MSEIKYIPVTKIVKDLNLSLVNTTNDWESIKISSAFVNRAGLDLTGFIGTKHTKRILTLGQKEDLYLQSLSKTDSIKALNKLFDIEFPCAILSVEFTKTFATLKKIAAEKNKLVFQSSYTSNNLIATLIPYLNAQLAPVTLEHGCAMNVWGKGVLIAGESGMGKSELSLALAKKNHFFVADDQVELKNVNGKIIAQAPMILERLIEIRGVGVIDVTSMLGHQVYLKQTEINLVINLVDIKNFKSNRVGAKTELETINLCGINIPKIVIPVSAGRNLSELVETAVVNLKLIEAKIDGNKELNQRTLKALKSK